MEKIPVGYYYRKAVFYPALIATGAYIIYSVIYIVAGLGKNYKSEWLTADSFVFPMIMMSIVHALIVCILACPIFLNNFKLVRNNIVLNFLSWFLLPYIWLGYILIMHIFYTKPVDASTGNDIFIYCNTLPFVLGLLWYYIRFITEKRKTQHH